MSTAKLKRIQVIREQPGWLDIAVPPEMVEEFKEVIKRGTYFGTQTSPDMKEFADNILERPWCAESKMKEGAQSQLEYVLANQSNLPRSITEAFDWMDQRTEQLLAD